MAEELKTGAEQTAAQTEVPTGNTPATAPPEPEKPKSFKDKYWEPILSPLVSLVVICLVTSLLLGLTNAVTEPMIDANTAAAADAARQELLPEADGFEQVQLPIQRDNITSMYKATNGVGYIIESYGRGYGGNVPAMVAFDADGNVKAVKFLSNSETPGLGKKLETDTDFSGQFAGRPAALVDSRDVDMIASSTISSKAAIVAINAAIQLYQEQVIGESCECDIAGETENPLRPDGAASPTLDTSGADSSSAEGKEAA